MHALQIILRILGVIREFKYSNLNTRYKRVTSKGIALLLGHTVRFSYIFIYFFPPAK